MKTKAEIMNAKLMSIHTAARDASLELC